MTYFHENGNPMTDNYTLIYHHKLCNSQDIPAHGIIMAGNNYDHPLITSDLPLNCPCANSYNSKEYAMKKNPVFTKSCQVDTVQAVPDYQETHFAMQQSQCQYNLPFKDTIIQAILVHKIGANTERIIWHQCLGHLCDE